MQHVRWAAFAVFVLLPALASCGGSGASGPVGSFPTVDPVRWSLSPTSLPYGSVAPGTTKTLHVAVTNVSASTSATISSAVMPGSEFSLVDASFPVVLAPGEVGGFDLRYEPTDTTYVSGTLRFLEAFGGPEARIAVSGGSTSSAETEIVTDYGMQPLSGSGATPLLYVTVPVDAISLSIEAEYPGGQIGIQELTGPGGHVYENAASTGDYIWAPGWEVALFGLPNTDRTSGRLIEGGGTYSFRLKRMYGSGNLMAVRAIVERRDAATADLGQVDLNVWLADGIAPKAATASTDVRLQAILASISNILSQQGLTLGEVDYYDVTNPAYDRVTEAEFAPMLRLTAAAAAERLNLFFVIEAFGGGVVGVSPTVGGPKVNGSPASGVMSVYDQGLSTGLIGVISAHEIGHYLGLQHTAEANGAHDSIDDTAECPGTGTSRGMPNRE